MAAAKPHRPVQFCCTSSDARPLARHVNQRNHIYWPSTLGEAWSTFQYISILLKELNIGPAMAVFFPNSCQSTSVGQSAAPTASWNFAWLESTTGSARDSDRFSHFASHVPPLGLATSIDHARFWFWPNGLLKVQVSLILCRIIIPQLEVGPAPLNHPNLLRPEVLDYALLWAQGCKCLIGTPISGIHPKPAMPNTQMWSHTFHLYGSPRTLQSPWPTDIANDIIMRYSYTV